MDLEGIEPSEKWLDKLYTAIDSTQAFVFIISEASVSSAYCEDEIRRANESRKKRMFFSPDGQTLATVTAFSNMLRLWEVPVAGY